MEEEKDLELRSEEVKEIMGRPPSWIIRWGSTVAFGVVGLLILFASIFEYPDYRTAQVKLTTTIPPAEVVSTIDASIEKIFVTENEAVRKGEPLVVLKSTADFTDVGILEGDIRDLQDADETEMMAFRPDPNLQVGSLQDDYSELKEHFQTYNRDKNTSFDRQAINKIYASKNAINESIGFERDALGHLQIELASRQRDQERTKELYRDGIKSIKDLEEANAITKGVMARVKNTQSRIVSKRQQLNQLDQQILTLQETKVQTISFNYVRVTEELNRLLSAIESWKEKYVLNAPIDGVIAFPDNHKENQHVEQNEKILNVIPDKGGGWILQGELPTTGAGKVERGQHVVIKFDNYPYQDYGIVEGEVDDISLMPRGNSYNIIVKLKNGLVTSHRDSLHYNQDMKGVAEIITENKSLMAWFFDRLVSQVKHR